MAQEAKDLLREIRESRLKSYQSTPGDIEEHRRAELRVAGDTAGRPLIELIQNADDAMQEAKGACYNRRVSIVLKESGLLVANDGAPFTKEGVEAICNLDRSPKKDPRITIGNKGIGFKSVLCWTEIPSIYSTSYKFTFDRRRAAQEITKALSRSFTPNDVPIMRLPFEMETYNEPLRNLFDEGFITTIALPLKSRKVYEEICEELRKFDPLTLLFLNSVSRLTIVTPAFEKNISVLREPNKIIIDIDGKNEEYKLFKDEKPVRKKLAHQLPDDHRDLTHAAFAIALPKSPLDVCPNIFSHFPTTERCPFPFFVHGDLILDAGRKHLRGDAAEYNQWVIQQIAILFVNRVLSFLAKEQGAGLIDYIESRSQQEMQEAEKLIFDSFSQYIGRKAFLPVLGESSKTVSPRDSLLSDPKTINEIYSLFHKGIQWEERYLIEPDWCEGKRIETLAKFGGNKLKTSECIKIIGRAAKPEKDWCTRALDTILKWIEKAPDWKSQGTESKSDLAYVLKHQPIFYTSRDKIRPLKTEEPNPLFLPPAGDKSLDIPRFIPMDFLHPEIGNIFEKKERDEFEKRLESLSKYGLYPFRPKEIIERAVIPIIPAIEDALSGSVEDKEKLLRFLVQLDPSGEKFDDIEPYPWFDRVRTELARHIPVPSRDGNWMPAWKLYAGSDWGAQEKLSIVYDKIPDRAFLASPNDAIHRETSTENWKGLYRYLGVSWEPKILPVEKSPDYISHYHLPNVHPLTVSNDDWEEYVAYMGNERSLSDMWGWTITIKESYVLDSWLLIKNDPERSLPLIDLLYITGIFSYLVGDRSDKIRTSFQYTKRTWSYSASCESFLKWSINNLRWLSLPDGTIYSPSELFLANSEIGKALKGVVPTIDLQQPHGKASLRRWEDLLDEIGIRGSWEQIGVDDWSNWLKEIAEKGKEIQREQIGLIHTLYRFCLERCPANDELPPFKNALVFCFGKNGWDLTLPTEAIYFDQQRLDAVKPKVMEAGWLFFPVELGAPGRPTKAKTLFGMSLASEKLTENVVIGTEEPDQTEEWNRKFESVRPVLLARLAKDRPEKRTEDEEFFKSLKLTVFDILRRRFCLVDTNDCLLEEEATVCWGDDGDNNLLLNVNNTERALWSGIGESLASRLGQNYYEAFEAILLCSTDQERIDKLRKSGVPEEDILYCKQALEEIPKSPPPKKRDTEEKYDLKQGLTREKEEEWKQGCPPEDAAIKVEEFEPVREKTLKSHLGETAKPSSEEKIEKLEEAASSLSGDKKKIGRWGEQYVLQCLKKALSEKYPDTFLEDCDEGFNVRRSAEVVAQVHWLNKHGEKQESHDVEVFESENKDFIEVKSTIKDDKDWFDISKPQWEFAKKEGANFYIYRVYGAGTANPRLVIIKDPYERWQKGDLIANPIKICI